MINEKVSVIELKKKWNERDTSTCKQSSTICIVNTVSTKTIKTYPTHAIKCNSGIVANPNPFYAKIEFKRAKPKFLDCNRDT